MKMEESLEGYIHAMSAETWKEDYIPKPLISIDNRKIHDFNKETGVLRVKLSKSALEEKLSELGELPKEGIAILMPKPCGPPPLYLEGVKKIESVSSPPNHEKFSLN